MKRKKHADAALIASLGGPTKVAQMLGFDPRQGGVQRVQNWTQRGIPELLKYQRPDVFGQPEPQADAA